MRILNFTGLLKTYITHDLVKKTHDKLIMPEEVLAPPTPN